MHMIFHMKRNGVSIPQDAKEVSLDLFERLNHEQDFDDHNCSTRIGHVWHDPDCQRSKLRIRRRLWILGSSVFLCPSVLLRLRRTSLRMSSRHTVTVAESASDLETIAMAVTADTMAVMVDTTAVTVGIMVEIMADTTVAMADTTADTAAMADITDSVEMNRLCTRRAWQVQPAKPSRQTQAQMSRSSSSHFAWCEFGQSRVYWPLND